MHRKLLIPVALLLLAAGCATGGSGTSGNGPDLKLQLVQTTPIPDVFYFGGPVNVQYQLAIENPTEQAVSLERIELGTASSGAYRLRTSSTVIHRSIAPGGRVAVPISAWVYARGGELSADEPVSIRTTAWFQGPHGRFTRSAIDMIRPR
jgi:hypothetical protein